MKLSLKRVAALEPSQRASSKQLVSSISRQSSKKNNWEKNKQAPNIISEMSHILTVSQDTELKEETVGLCGCWGFRVANDSTSEERVRCEKKHLSIFDGEF